MMAHDLRKAVLTGGGSHMPPPSAAHPASLGQSIAEGHESSMGFSSAQNAAGSLIGSIPLFDAHARSKAGSSSWQAYWDSKEVLDIPSRGGRFNVYAAGPLDGPLVMCLHGGGYTGLTWSLVAPHLKHKYRVVAPDLRCHGETSTDNDLDFSKETMTQDILAICERLTEQMTSTARATAQPSRSTSTSTSISAAAAAATGPPIMNNSSIPTSSNTTDSTSSSTTSTAAASSGGSGSATAVRSVLSRVPVVLVGHSMGGGLAVWAAASRRIAGLEGLVVIDVVEGTAMAALPHMVGVVNARPTTFDSMEEALAWATRTGMARNKQAAAVSLPSQLRPAAAGSSEQQRPSEPACIDEDAPSTAATSVPSSSSPTAGWVWRTPLLASQPYWEGWYRGLSEAFLGVQGAKALLLAGTDRLDKPLTIGQMQGKFQLILMPTAGHAIQEDEADKTAEHLVQFLKRFRIGEPPLQFPKAPSGIRPVLPLAAGMVHDVHAGPAAAAASRQ